MRRCNTGFEDGNYGLPSGHIEDNESISEGTAREISEEIGIGIHPAQLKLVHVMHRKGTDIRIDFFFEAQTWEGEPKNMEQRCDDLKFFPLNKLPSNTIGYIKSALEQYQTGNIFSEFGWETNS